jgi:hypothetical protein
MSAIATVTRVLGPGAAAAVRGRTPLVVFAHAAGFCKEVWQPVFHALDHELKHGWQCFVRFFWFVFALSLQ